MFGEPPVFWLYWLGTQMELLVAVNVSPNIMERNRMSHTVAHIYFIPKKLDTNCTVRYTERL
jgi:hypothetical protein